VANSAPGGAPSVNSMVMTMPKSTQTYSKNEWTEIVKSMQLKPKQFKTIKQGKALLSFKTISLHITIFL
jgi:hypothetical protein